MGYYSDPTAAQALGNINKEFSRLEKKAKRLLALLDEGKISEDSLKRAQENYTGIYRHVLTLALEKKAEENSGENG